MESGRSWKEELEQGLKSLATLLRDEKTISSYEVHLSRLVPVLLHCLTGVQKESENGGGVEGANSPENSRARERVEVFKHIFSEAALDESPSDLDLRYIYRE